jgi:hypothetical protein
MGDMVSFFENGRVWLPHLKPEHAGQLNIFVTPVDENLKNANNQPLSVFCSASSNI